MLLCSGRSSEFSPQTAVSSSDTPAVPWLPHTTIYARVKCPVSPRLQGSENRGSRQCFISVTTFSEISWGKTRPAIAKKDLPQLLARSALGYVVSQVAQGMTDSY